MRNIFHKIRAFLYKNLLTDRLDDFVARVISDRSLNAREVCEASVTRGGADTTVAAMEHHVRLFMKEMTYQLCDGYSINTEWFNLSVHVKGVFDSPTERFNPDKHTVVVEFRMGTEMRKALTEVDVEIMGVADGAGEILRVVDVKSGTTNSRLTPERNLRIQGDKLKIAGDGLQNGVWFVNQANGESTKVDDSDMVLNNPAELLLVIPMLAAGKYHVEVVTNFTGSNKLLKEARTIKFDRDLVVY